MIRKNLRLHHIDRQTNCEEMESACCRTRPNADISGLKPADGGKAGADTPCGGTVPTDEEISLLLDKIVDKEQSAKKICKNEAIAKEDFEAELKWYERVRKIEATALITDYYKKPWFCPNKDETTISLAKECVDRMRFLKSLLNSENREVVGSIAKMVVSEEFNTLKTIKRESSHRKSELKTLNRHENEFREKYKAYKADEHRRLMQFFSDLRKTTMEEYKKGSVTELLQIMEQVKSARKATLDLKSLLSCEATVPILQKDVDSYKSKVNELSQELQLARAAFECTICFLELEGAPARKKVHMHIGLHEDASQAAPSVKPRARACFSPCFHASVCFECATKVWDGTQKCPLCNVQLSQPPSPIYF